MAVRLAIDAMRGEGSPYESQLTEEEKNFREAAQFAIFKAARERQDWLELRAEHLAKLKERCDRYLRTTAGKDSRALVRWIGEQKYRYRTLRGSAPADVAEEMGYEL